MSPPHLSKPTFSSPALSLALQPTTGGVVGGGSGGAGGVGGGGSGSGDFDSVGRNREEEYESRSGSDNVDGGSGDEQDPNQPPSKKKRYHRHTPQQIQELESLFKECPHPDEKQRLELSRRLNLESRQVKFWFQNRRTQMKTQLERHENQILRNENDKLRAENMSIRDAMRNPICTNCGGPALLGEVSLEEQHLRIENARLKDELDRVCTLAGKFLGRPISTLAHHPERQVFLELALAAMDELLKMAHGEDPLWMRSLDGGRETLNYEEYLRVFPRCIGVKPVGFATEATRETGLVIINGLALVETLMDANRWEDMFPTMVSRASTTDVISNGMGGTRNCSLQLMHAEFQVLSPLVPVREVNFLRFCKQHTQDIWAVVDISIDCLVECRRLPSGCVIQDMPNGYSKVTWVEHAEYEENGVHHLYRNLLCSGMAFGAQRWVATLQRQCECLAILMSSIPTRDHNVSAITPNGARSMLKLAQRMTDNFCKGVCASTVHKWEKLTTSNTSSPLGADIRVMTRQSVNDPGEPAGVVLSAATSVWLPVPPVRIFDFLRDERLRSDWDILSNGGPMHEMTHIAKGQEHGNCVSLLRASAMSPDQTGMLVLQETCIDSSGALVVYAPVDIPAMHLVMNGGDSSYVALLPSGFAIVPDGPARDGNNHNSNGGGGGSLLTIAFQILVNNLPMPKLNAESVDTVNNLINCTVQKIKAAIHGDS
ncbi:Homeobox-leucine zipper protein ANTHOCYANINLESS 2 [Acorus gramineus]|uniref:Homeobox-leucine zipper protein ANTHOCYANINLESS 2 n=1 Tax=Acorus gramineus TaxID=55184 RepID=A0AAV8ZXJ6_ACOGR|nr:Homeobox-leucine zipper protein ANTHOCYANINLESS 2 [Acorus gramineus]